MKQDASQAVALYTSRNGEVTLEVTTTEGSVWLNRRQLAALFGRDIKTIGKHIARALAEELKGMATVANFATVAREGTREVTRQVEHYNLDMVLSVGYRVKSAEGVHFRRWANTVLKRYLVEGAALNEPRLRDLQRIIEIMKRSDHPPLSRAADIIARYLPSLALLQDYDNGAVPTEPRTTARWVLTEQEARAIVARVASEFPDNTLLGRERGDSLAAVLGAIYQSFDGRDLYPTAEEKAANLLYLMVKDHPLSDGNKRSAAALFVTFLEHHGLLTDAAGTRRIANNTLTALTLMVAMSRPREKDLMTALLVRMITEEH
ncbi:MULTISPECIES: virulence protein RhuM/Fic/DOC family protein [unclassified Corynebacterium]|uniref:virulence protein RhuM/Fic/DOC family protein n=1 Tax=unclassified Corynebacterium TaxID=2624378 RepID=UPI00128C715F|nr:MULTISPECIES: virulence protein RhuM/Fic/DOC family protein [unclassified Corynebacterium]